jgi:membrane dipeptidase
MRLRYVDLHCDTLKKVWQWRAVTNACSFMRNPFSVDMEKLQCVRPCIQTCALFFEEAEHEHIWDVLGEVQSRYGPSIVRRARDVRTDGIGMLLAVEGAGAYVDDVCSLVDAGVRMVSLTWNTPNVLGHPCTMPQMGLTKKGMSFVDQLEAQRVLIDVAHLSEQGIWDVLARTTAPIVASHTNAYAVTAHPRNVSDAVIRAIAQRGGVIGLTFCAPFTHAHRSWSIVDWMRHVWHVVHVGGSESIAIGSDFDGIDNDTEFGDVSGIPLLCERLHSLGMASSLIDKLMAHNAMRVLTTVLPS